MILNQKFIVRLRLPIVYLNLFALIHTKKRKVISILLDKKCNHSHIGLKSHTFLIATVQ